MTLTSLYKFVSSFSSLPTAGLTRGIRVNSRRPESDVSTKRMMMRWLHLAVHTSVLFLISNSYLNNYIIGSDLLID
jgi:hypothetical protein